MHQRIDDAAIDARRRPGDVLRLYNVNGRIMDGPPQGWLVGGRDPWLEQLRYLHGEQRVDAFIFWPDGGHTDRQLHAYAGSLGSCAGALGRRSPARPGRAAQHVVPAGSWSSTHTTPTSEKIVDRVMGSRRVDVRT